MINSVTKFYDLDNNFSGYIMELDSGERAHVPLDPLNKDYNKIQQLVQAGTLVIAEPE